MTTINATLAEPAAEADAAVRRAAAQHGYALAEGLGPQNVLIFKKGASLFSWGSQVSVELVAVSPTTTQLVFTTAETLAITDWGRGKRAVRKLVDAAGASVG